MLISASLLALAQLALLEHHPAEERPPVLPARLDAPPAALQAQPSLVRLARPTSSSPLELVLPALLEPLPLEERPHLALPAPLDALPAALQE